MSSTSATPRPKRVNNTGSAYYVRSEKRWRAQFFDATGKLRHLSGKTQQEVVARLDRAIVERDQGTLGLAPKVTPTVGEYFDAWLQSKYDLKPKTRDRYRNDIDLYIRPYLGHVRLDQLKASMIESLYGRLLNERGLAPATVRHVHATLSTALRQAHHHDLLPTPLMAKVKAPRVPAVKRKIIPEQTIRELLQRAESQGLRPYVRWRLALLWGLRQGEVLGLRWSDVDLETGYIHIRQQMQYFPGEGMKAAPPKADSSVRSFRVDDLTLDALKALRAEQLGQRLAAEEWRDLDLVISTETGLPVDSANDRRQFKRLLRACGAEDFRVHDARSTAITNWVMDGTPVPTIQSIAGHSDFRTTTSYIHLTEEAYDSAADAVGRRFA